MRLVLITSNYQPATVVCGVGDYTRCLRHALESLGHHCAVITSARTRTTEAEVYRLPGTWGPRDTLTARRIVASLAPDAVFLQYTPEHYGFGVAFKLLPLLLRLFQRPPRIVTTFHTLVGGRWISRPYAALLAAISHGIISTNAELTDLFRRRLPRWTGKLREIPIGANIPVPQLNRDDARRRLHDYLGIDSGVPIIGTFGFPAPGKGLDTLLQAVRQLHDPPSVHLLYIGETRAEDESYQAWLADLAGQLGVADRVHWVGALPSQDVSDLLSGSDAYVVPYDDGANLRRGTLMAGFQAGLPIITTTPRYADPALRPGETILSVPPQSPEALAERIRSLLADAAIQDHLRNEALALRHRFEWRAIAQQHVELIEHLITEPACPA